MGNQCPNCFGGGASAANGGAYQPISNSGNSSSQSASSSHSALSGQQSSSSIHFDSSPRLPPGPHGSHPSLSSSPPSSSGVLPSSSPSSSVLSAAAAARQRLAASRLLAVESVLRSLSRHVVPVCPQRRYEHLRYDHFAAQATRLHLERTGAFKGLRLAGGGGKTNDAQGGGTWGAKAPAPASDLRDGADVLKALDGRWHGGRTRGKGGDRGDDDDDDDDNADGKDGEENGGDSADRDAEQWDKAYGEAMAEALGGGGAGIFKRMESEEWGGGGIVDHL
jgi:hypothetical protein